MIYGPLRVHIPSAFCPQFFIKVQNATFIKKLRFELTKCKSWLSFFENALFGLKKWNQTGSISFKQKICLFLYYFLQTKEINSILAKRMERSYNLGEGEEEKKNKKHYLFKYIIRLLIVYSIQNFLHMLWSCFLFKILFKN